MSTSENVIFGFILTLSVLSFLLNGTFLIVIYKNWTLVKRRRVTYHVTNLSIADCIVGASVFGFCVSTIAAGEETMLSSAFKAIVWAATLTSLLSVCLMAIERTVCIKKPHTWNQILPLKRILIAMTVSWVLPLVLGILSYFFTLTIFLGVILIYIPIIVTAVLYINVYCTIRKAHSNEVHDETQQSSPDEAINERRNNLMQQKVASFVLILTIVMLITMTPLLLTLTVISTCELFELNCKFIETAKVLEQYFYLLSMVNFVVNPIFYVWRLSMYRKAFWKMFGRADSENS